MKFSNEFTSENVSNLMLYGAITLAGIDYTGVLDYVLKAFLGGAVWFGFKLLQDHYSVKVRSRSRKQAELNKRKEREP